MTTTKIIYWTTTSILFLMEGVMPALTSQTELAKEGIAHLGYPPYFGVMLTVFKILGAIALIVPMVSIRIKEWAYAGFGISLIAALVGHLVIDGVSVLAFSPLIVLAILIISNIYLHKLRG